MKDIYLFLLLALVWGSHPVSGQDSARIMLRARVQKDAILLRWATTTPLSWKQTNRSGFRIERYTLVRNKQVLTPSEKKVLAENVRAIPLEAWMTYIEKDDNAGIIAQALYGDSFELTGGDEEGVATMINMAQELEQRYTFSLYAADQNFDVACLAGWGFKDTDVKKGERYLYRVIPATYEDSCRIEMGAVFTGTDEYRPLPRPQEFTAIWNDKSVMLAWNYSALADVYNSYYIEKSRDGKNFERIEGRPVSSVDERQKEGSQRLFYVDSLADNRTVYYYRLRGVSAFGEWGPVSDTVSGKGLNVLPYVPSIRKALINGEGELEMEWQFDDLGVEFIECFQLRVSDKANGVYRTVVDQISPAARSLKYDRLHSGSYFTIKAVALEGESRVSYPVLVQPLDTVPPVVPVGLRGTIDSLGIVRLEWTPNTEPDLSGYIVFRAFTATEEAIPLFDVPLSDTCFVDTVEIKNLNPIVYYQIIALDKRYNRSGLSERVEVVKPDVIPPVSPVFSDYHIQGKGIELIWVNSPDTDVQHHLLYRQEYGSKDSAGLLCRFPGNSIDRFVDTTAIAGKKYRYTIFAVDRSNLVSLPTPPMTLIAPKTMRKDSGISGFDAVVDKQNLLIKLVWRSELQDIRSYEIYKSEGDASYSLWKSLPGWQREVLDDHVAVSMKYRYMIRALFEKGGNSGIREIIIKGL